MSQGTGGDGGRTVQTGFGGQGEQVPGMPLRAVILAELTARDLRTGSSTETRRKIKIDRQSFDEVMASFALRAFLDVTDRLTESSKPLIAELEFRNLKSFGPDAVAEQIPGTRDLLKLRAALADLRSGKQRVADVRGVLSSLETQSAVVESVRRALEAPPAEATAPAPTPQPDLPPPAAGDLDALLSMVEAPEGAPAEASRGADLSRLDALIRHLVKSEQASERVEGRAVEAAIREIDAALSAQIDEVLHHPEFRRLEATWRSLRFLTDRTDFQQPIRMEVISTGREALLSVYDEVIHAPEAQGISHEPLAFVVVDQLFDKTPEDVDLLRALSERGAHLSVPILASVGSRFLGLSRTADLAKASQVRDTFGGPEYAKWQGLRESGPSRWLGLVFNRFLLRAAYAPGERSARSFDYVEGIPADDLRLWGSGVWALAALAVRSFARIGWCTDLMGQRASGMVEDLPVRLFERPGAEQVSFPLETTIADDVERDLSANGVMALTAALNSDRAYLRFAPMVHAPQHYQNATDRARARLQSTLPFQFFVGRLLNYAMLIEDVIVPGRGAEEISASYDRALRSLLATAGNVPPDAVKVAVVPNEEDSSRQDLYLKVTWPGFQSLPGAGAVELRWPLVG